MKFLDWMRMNRAMKAVGSYDLDDVLCKMGLERRSVAGDIAADIGFFALGCLAGALAGVFFAPIAGEKMRANVKRAIDERSFEPLTPEMKEGIRGQA